MFGIHVRIFNNYGSYRTVILTAKGKARIWVNKLPTHTACEVKCKKCGKKYFIKYKSWEK